MFDMAMGLLMVFATAAVGDTIHFDSEFIENMVRGVGIFTILVWTVQLILELLKKPKKD